ESGSTTRHAASSTGVHAYRLSYLVQDVAQLVVVRVAQAHPRVCHVAFLDRLRRGAGGRQERGDDAVAVAPADFINPGVPADVTIPFRSQRDHSSRVPPRRLLVCASVDDRAGPFEVQVEIVSGIVDVPLPDARRPAPDLRKPEPLRPGEPFHVGRGGSDLEYPDYVPRHLAYFGIAGRV